MKEFFSGMSGMEQTYWVVALVGTFVFLIIFVITFLGFDHDADVHADVSDMDADDGGVGFQFFTFKNVIAFLTIFGWTGLVCIQNKLGVGLSLFLSVLAGLIMMVLTSLLFYWMHKMAESGTLKMSNAIGMVGEVYIPIKSKRQNIGKVQIKVQGSLHELEAMTDEEFDLPTGSVVEVKDLIGPEILLVVKK
jgi:membrane protein implicated in regulation of membrane protease activity